MRSTDITIDPRTGGPVVPLPDLGRSVVAIAAPGSGPGYWAGGPSAVADGDAVYLAYRLRRPVGDGRGYVNVVARAEDGVHFDTVNVLSRDDFVTDSLERPALVRRPDGGWRIYVSCATPGTLHWRVDAIDADDPSAFAAADRVTVLAGTDTVAYKDPVVRVIDGVWHQWVCRHDVGVPADADRMITEYATSADGLAWQIHGTALAPRAGTWDARGTRVSAVLTDRPDPVAYYDGRATAEQNWHEQTGVAFGADLATFAARGSAPAVVSPNGQGGLRYLDVLAHADGSYRLYYEAARPDGAHDLRTEYVPPVR